MTNAPLRRGLHEANRLSWNEATKAHNSHKADQAKFLREGGKTLFPEEQGLLGDVKGLSLLHLQCNSGQDTLSLAQLGAVVTGVDISDEAIAFAQQLSQESGIPARFYRADVYDWLAAAAMSNQRFDVVFCSYGCMFWLSNLQVWAQGIATVLKPGGRFILIEFHPFAMMFDSDWTRKFPYFNEGQNQTWDDGISDYVGASGANLTPSGYVEGVQNFKNPYRTHEFHWGLGEIVTALLSAGLTLTVLKEYPYSNGCQLFGRMQATPEGQIFPPENVPNLPLMYAIMARM